MPATTPKPKEPAKKEDTRGDIRYVRCDLNKEQKTALAAWSEEVEDVDLKGWIEHRVGNGHTLTIRSNDVGYQASLTGTREASGHTGQCLIARASSPVKAMLVCWYKDEFVLQGAWPIGGALDDLDL